MEEVRGSDMCALIEDEKPLLTWARSAQYILKAVQSLISMLKMAIIQSACRGTYWVHEGQSGISTFDVAIKV